MSRQNACCSRSGEPYTTSQPVAIFSRSLGMPSGEFWRSSSIVTITSYRAARMPHSRALCWPKLRERSIPTSSIVLGQSQRLLWKAAHCATNTAHEQAQATRGTDKCENGQRDCAHAVKLEPHRAVAGRYANGFEAEVGRKHHSGRVVHRRVPT